MAASCTHLDSIDHSRVPSSSTGCPECQAIGSRWVHLRMCSACGHIGCCNSSPNKHATRHHDRSGHPLIRSFEPREEWFFCYPDNMTFELGDAPPAPSHT